MRDGRGLQVPNHTSSEFCVMVHFGMCVTVLCMYVIVLVQFGTAYFGMVCNVLLGFEIRRRST